jgi:hypothetical protein
MAALDNLDARTRSRPVERGACLAFTIGLIRRASSPMVWAPSAVRSAVRTEPDEDLTQACSAVAVLVVLVHLDLNPGHSILPPRAS